VRRKGRRKCCQRQHTRQQTRHDIIAGRNSITSLGNARRENRYCGQQSVVLSNLCKSSNTPLTSTFEEIQFLKVTPSSLSSQQNDLDTPCHDHPLGHPVRAHLFSSHILPQLHENFEDSHEDTCPRWGFEIDHDVYLHLPCQIAGGVAGNIRRYRSLIKD